MIQLDDERYWLYAAVDHEINELLHTALELTTNDGISHAFFAELREKHDTDDVVFLINDSHPLKYACRRHSLDFRYNVTEIGIASNVSFRNETTNYQFLNLFRRRQSRHRQ